MMPTKEGFLYVYGYISSPSLTFTVRNGHRESQHYCAGLYEIKRCLLLSTNLQHPRRHQKMVRIRQLDHCTRGGAMGPDLYLPWLLSVWCSFRCPMGT